MNFQTSPDRAGFPTGVPTRGRGLRRMAAGLGFLALLTIALGAGLGVGSCVS